MNIYGYGKKSFGSRWMFLRQTPLRGSCEDLEAAKRNLEQVGVEPTTATTSDVTDVVRSAIANPGCTRQTKHFTTELSQKINRLGRFEF